MASWPGPSSVLFILLLMAFAAVASAATFTIRNNCPYRVWPAATPVGGGRRLTPGQTWTLEVPAGTNGGRIWGRTGCSFDSAGRGHCTSADCGGVRFCTLSGQPPLTLAEFSIGGGGANDYYDISVVDGFNLPMDFSCSNGLVLRCREDRCPDAYLYPTDDNKNHACQGNSDYTVTFCP